MIEPMAAGQALGWAPARAGLTPLVAPATASRCCVPKVAQRARVHTLPVGAGATEGLCNSARTASEPVALPGPAEAGQLAGEQIPADPLHPQICKTLREAKALG